MSYDNPEPEYPEPEDNPEGYANYLRRKVIALARQYFVEQGNVRLVAEHSYGQGPGVSLWNVEKSIEELDEWKREFKLTDID